MHQTNQNAASPPSNRPRKRVIRNIFLLFGLLIAAIIGNTLYVTYQGDKYAKHHNYEDLKTKLNFVSALQNNALEKLNVISGIVKEQSQRYCDFIDYDNHIAITFMLKSLAAIHNIDLAFVFDEYGDLLASYPKGGQDLPVYGRLLNDQRKRVSIETIPAQIVEAQLPELATYVQTSEALCFKSVIPLLHDTGAIYGYVVLIKLINGNKTLAQRMAHIAEAEVVYYDQNKRTILTSFADSQIPYPDSDGLTVKGQPYFVFQKRIADFTGQTIGALAAAINKKSFLAQRKWILFNNLTPFFISIVISFALFALLKLRVFNKIRALIAVLRKVTEGEGNLSIRLKMPPVKIAGKNLDEVEYMGIDFNLMMDKLEGTQKQLIDARKEAELASISKSEFLANMSHEIRTPMNAVIGFSDMLLETRLNHTQIDYANMIKNSGDALLSLINDILDFSKIEAGEMTFEETDFDPESLAYNICDIIRPKIGSKPIEVLCRVEDDVPALVRGDPVRFQQVLINLMDNAPKFTETGEIELSLALEKEEETRVKLHATIRDTGIGIRDENLLKVFEPFQQADGSTTRKYGGTGLGLSICKKISNLMDGDVWADVNETEKIEDAGKPLSSPTVGKTGSTFHFTAWLKKAKEEIPPPSIPMALSGKKALIADGNPNSLRILTHMLQSVGMVVVSLNQGEAVLPALEKGLSDKKPFFICIIDIPAPQINGFELAAKIRTYHSPIKERQMAIRNTPLLAMSSIMANNPQEFEKAGFDDFLRKPIRKRNIFQSIEKITEKRNQHKLKAQKPAAQKQFGGHPNPGKTENAVRVLIVEDNLVNQKLAKMMLKKAGYHVHIANNGKEAVEIYTANSKDYDIILMDIQMPEMDGFEATEEIRQFEIQNRNLNEQMMREATPTQGNPSSIQRVPIIAMTAHAMKGDREKCLEGGMDDYIAKPIKREIVMGVLEKWALISCGISKS